MLHNLAFFGSIGPWEVVALLAVGLLIFGKRLPEVGKSLGKGIVEFKKGLAGIEDDVQQSVSSSKPTSTPREPAQLDSNTASHSVNNTQHSATPIQHDRQ